MGIGTDVYPHNMLDEMRLVFLHRTGGLGEPAQRGGGEIFNAATIGGARALGRDDIGRLAVGCKADVVIVDCAHPAMRPCHDPLRSLVYSASERAVMHVFVDGEQVVRDQKVLTIDYEAASAALEEAQARGLSDTPTRLGGAKRGGDRGFRLPPKIEEAAAHKFTRANDSNGLSALSRTFVAPTLVARRPLKPDPENRKDRFAKRNDRFRGEVII